MSEVKPLAVSEVKPLDVAVIVPARNEEEVLPQLLARVTEASPWPGARLREVLVVDNGSSDRTASVARAAGARVIREPRRGYGRACRTGITALARRPPTILIFLDADDFEAPAQIGVLLGPILQGEADLVIGERRSGKGGGVRIHAAVGNRFISAVLHGLYGSLTRDLGPFRAVRWPVLCELALDDPNYGWYVQMQVRALRLGYRIVGVPVEFRRRTAGRSKVSGSMAGSLAAGWVMLQTLAVEAFRAPRR